MSSLLRFELKFSPRYKPVDAVNYEICKENHLPLRLQLQALEIKFQVKAIFEIKVEVFGKEVEVAVKWNLM